MTDVDRPWDAPEPTPLLQVPPTLGTAAGGTVELGATVTNAAASPRIVSVVALGIDPAWTAGAVRTEVLAPGASTSVVLPLSPPPGTFPAQYPLVVTAQSLDPDTLAPLGGGPAAIAESSLVVNPRTQLSLELQPEETSLVVRRRFGVLLRNDGALPAEVRLESQTTRGLRVRLPERAVVPAGGSTRVRGRIRAARPRFVGHGSDHQLVVTARGTEAVRHASGSVRQRSVIGPVGAKAAAVLTVLAIWIAGAVVFVPQLSDWLAERGDPTVSTTTEGGGGDGADDGGSDPDAGGDGGGGSGGGAGGGKPGAEATGAGSSNRKLRLTGTVAADRPEGVSVRLEPTTLVDEDVQRGVRGVGVAPEVLTQSGMRLASSFLPTKVERTEPTRTVRTSPDGSWSFPPVRRPGYYLVTFSKAGYQEQKYVVDSQTAAAEEPLEVSLAPAEGTIRGLVTGPGDDRVGGATITISDGQQTVTTSSASRGKDIGAWEITGLSTPATYVVEARQHNLSSEARMVRLDAAAGASERADLTLKRGVRSLSGRVTSQGWQRRANQFGVGLMKVTVTDGAGTTRETTTVTGDGDADKRAGKYIVPDLPAPGTYTVTVTGEGYQTATRTVTLTPGGRQRAHSFEVVPTTGQVTGTVSLLGRPGADVDAGLVLANEEHTYKAATDDSGAYSLDAVAPGDYTLSVQAYLHETEHVAVSVAPGPSPKDLDLALRVLPGDGFPATSRVKGTLVDASTGAPIDCDVVACRARVLSTADDSEVSPWTSFTGDAYDLPGRGNPLLPAGLHAVEVSAAGFQAAKVRVELSENETALAPTAFLHPAPSITGTVRSAVGGTALAACVWVVGDVIDPNTLPACQGAIDDGAAGETGRDACRPTPVRYDEETAPTIPAGQPYLACVATAANGGYDIEVPGEHDYWVHVFPLDPEHAPPAARQVTLGRAADVSLPVVVDRLGRARVRVLRPGPGNSMVPVGNVAITVSPNTTVDVPRTNGDGVAVVSGLARGVVSTFTVARAPGRPGGSTTLTAAPNAVVDRDLHLVDPVDTVVGRVLSAYDDAAAPLPGATVRIEAPATFTGATPSYAVVEPVTGADGCFAVRPDTVATLPDYSAQGCDATYSGEEQKVQPFASNHAREVRVTAPGYDDLVQPVTGPTAELSTTGVNPYQLLPSPVDFAASLRLSPAPAANADVAWEDIDLAVTDQPSYAGSVEVGLVPDEDTGTPDGIAELTWADSGEAAGKVLPGTYTVTATLEGYAPASGTLVCEVAGGCAFADPLALERLGTVVVETVLERGSDPDLAVDAAVDLVDPDPTVQPSASGNEFTFTGVAPGDDLDLRFDVRAAGYAHGRTVLDAAPGSSPEVRLDCADPGGPTHADVDRVSLEAGGTTRCRLLLTRLGSVQGTVVGLLDPAGTTTPQTRDLPHVPVTVQRCSAPANPGAAECSVVTGPVFTGLSDAHGRFLVTGSTQAGREGLRAGTWLVRAEAPTGFRQVDRSAGTPIGTVVEVAHGEPVPPDAVVPLQAVAVSLSVRVLDNYGSVVTDATLRLEKATEPGTAVGSTGFDEGRYVFPEVVPGTWNLVVSGGGLRTLTEVVHVEPSTGGAQELTVEVDRDRSTAKGLVLERPAGGPDVPVAGAEVHLCVADPAGIACATPGPAPGTDLAPMTATTDAAGRYRIETVPPGTFLTVVTRRGYTSVPPPAQTYGGALVVPDLDVVVAPVLNRVDVALTGVPGLALGTTSVRLEPRPGTPGAVQTATLAAGPGDTWTTSFSEVRWGCWQVEWDLPDDVLATPGGPSGSPTDPQVTCSHVVVPAEPETAVSLGFDLAVGALEYTVRATEQDGHDVPVVDLTFDSGTLEHEIASVSVVETLSDILWVPPGQYAVRADPVGVPATFWPSDDAVVDVPASGSGTADLELDELASRVTVVVDGLAPGEVPDLEIAPGPGQTANAPTLPAPADGVIEVDLASGPWLISGAWQAGPNQVLLDVTALTHTVHLPTAPPATP